AWRDSERDLVFHLVALKARRRVARSHAFARTAFATTIEHHKLAAEALQHDFGRITFGALFVGPFARLQRAFEIHFGTLAQILLGNLGEQYLRKGAKVNLEGA